MTEYNNILTDMTPGMRAMMEKRWKGVIDAKSLPECKDANLRSSMAVMLENTNKSLIKSGHNIREILAESMNDMTSGGDLKGDGYGDGGLSNVPNQGQISGLDQRLALATMPLARRMYTQLIAHQLVGVQAILQPVSFAFALRHMYAADANGKVPGENGYIGGDGLTGNDAEMVFGKMGVNAAFTGTSSEAIGFWNEYVAGGALGEGNWVQTAEGASFSGTGGTSRFPRAKIKLERSAIEAKERQFASSYTLEAAEDMLNLQGIDVDNELVTMLGNELKNEIDRELMMNLVGAAIKGGDKSLSTWDPTKADGRHQLERLGTLLTHIYQRSNRIMFNTKQSAANWMVASSNVCGLVERMGDQFLQNPGIEVDGSQISYTGTLKRGSIKVYKDAISAGNWILLGWKGNAVTETGVVFCPYVPVQLLKTPDPETFGNRLLARTRYGIHSNIFGAENYYQMIKLENIAGFDGSSGGEAWDPDARVFTTV